MMRNTRIICGAAVVLGFCFVGSSTFAATVLSKAQQDVVTAEIAELQMSEERDSHRTERTTFTFNCERETGTGKALSFETSLSSKQR